MTNITIQERTENFAIRVIKAYCELNKRHFADGRGLGRGFQAPELNSGDSPLAFPHERPVQEDDAGKVLSKQFLRSRTSIGANCSEAKYAQFEKYFISKYSIALKEANETLYWIKILIKSELVSKSRFQKMIEENETIIKILTTSIKKLKKQNEPKSTINYYLSLITYYSLLITLLLTVKNPSFQYYRECHSNLYIYLSHFSIL